MSTNTLRFTFSDSNTPDYGNGSFQKPQGSLKMFKEGWFADSTSSRLTPNREKSWNRGDWEYITRLPDLLYWNTYPSMTDPEVTVYAVSPATQPGITYRQPEPELEPCTEEELESFLES